MFTISLPPTNAEDSAEVPERVVTSEGAVSPKDLDEIKLAFGPEYLSGDLAPVCSDVRYPMRNIGLALPTRGAVIAAPASCAENLNLDKECLHAAMFSLCEYAAGRRMMLLVGLAESDPLVVDRLRNHCTRNNITLSLCKPPQRTGKAEEELAEVARLIAEAQVGIRCADDSFVPISAIGPISVMDETALKVAAQASLFFKPVPMPIIIYSDHTGSVCERGTTFERLEEYVYGKLPGVEEEVDRQRLIPKLLFLNPIPWKVEEEHMGLSKKLIETLNGQRANVCLTIESHSYSSGTWPTKSSLIRISELAEIREKLYNCRQLDASGLFGRVDHEIGGGEGYASRLRRLEVLWRETGGDTQGMFNWLAFSWAPKLKRAEFIPHFKCDICSTLFPCQDNEPLRKFDYTYCTMACLANHRKASFKPITG